MAGEQDRLKAYLNTVIRLESDITPIDANAAYASIAISLKRIADLMQLRADLDKEIKDRKEDAKYD